MPSSSDHKHSREGGYSAFVIKSSEGRRTGIKAEDARRYESQRAEILRGTKEQAGRLP